MVGLKSWRRKRRLQRAGTAADAARDRRDWSQAIVHYARVLEERPESGPIWIQYGHALKEHGLRSDAERAYARAILLLPDDADAHLQHGHALKLLGRREEAIAAFAAALRIDHGNRSAFNELVRMGARDRIDVAIGREERQRLSIGVETGARRLLGALDEAARNAAYARMSHDEFRQDFPIGPPPGPQRLDEDILIIVVTDGQVPAQLRSTLVSLIDQVVPEWRALVVGPADLAAHPVGSFSFVEPRIAFVSATAAIAAARACARIIVLDAGTIVEPQALAWLSAAARR
ncbi:MAG: glycosyltransferase, partial [Sphingomonas bacterium]|nr:glycosyltransferase [Sphingomonas bacterium]